jgi:predicted HTH domain antitoxin
MLGAIYAALRPETASQYVNKTIGDSSDEPWRTNMAPIISLELLEDELKAVVQAGAYSSKEEAIGHALEVLLAANAPLRIKTAVELYRQGTVTVARAAEMAGLELEAFKDQLATRQASIPTDETPEEIQAGAARIRRLRGST